MQPSVPPFCNAGTCGTCSGEGNDTDCRSCRFQLKASDPEKFVRENQIKSWHRDIVLQDCTELWSCLAFSLQQQESCDDTSAPCTDEDHEMWVKAQRACNRAFEL